MARYQSTKRIDQTKPEIDLQIQRTNWWLPEGLVGGWVKEEKGIKRFKLPVTKYIGHRDEKYSRGNTFNNIVTTLYRSRW